PIARTDAPPGPGPPPTPAATTSIPSSIPNPPSPTSPGWCTARRVERSAMAETRVTYDFVTRAIARTLGNPGKGYFALLGSAVALLAVGIGCLLMLLRYGLGLAGYSHPVYWAVYITCFVFWV